MTLAAPHAANVANAKGWRTQCLRIMGHMWVVVVVHVA
jgi:hypothetical protein